MSALTKTDFNFPGQTAVYHGKVRDVYSVGDKLVMVASDRISAFDVVLPEGIPYKGQMLNQIAAKFLDATADICPNWKMATPDPMVTVGVRCEGFAVEMIVRGYLCGSAWRAYIHSKAQPGCADRCVPLRCRLPIGAGRLHPGAGKTHSSRWPQTAVFGNHGGRQDPFEATAGYLSPFYPRNQQCAGRRGLG